jgi:thiol-disulfide isomerase/thioredoxin
MNMRDPDAPRGGGAQVEDVDQQEASSRLRSGLPLLLVVVGVGIVFAGLAISSPGPGEQGIFAVVDAEAAVATDPSAAPTISLPDLDGEGEVSAPTPGARATVVNFWASWCAPCREEAPDLEATFQRYQRDGVRFLGVNERDNLAAARTFARQVGFSFPSGFDPAGRLAFDYELLGMPTTVVIDAEGQVRYRFTGIVSASALRDALDSVLGPS